MKYKTKYPITTQPPFTTKRKERLVKGGERENGVKRNSPNFNSEIVRILLILFFFILV